MPDVRDQDTAASLCKLGLYSLDEIPADAPTSRPLRDDQFAQVCPEAKVVGNMPIRTIAARNASRIKRTIDLSSA